MILNFFSFCFVFGNIIYDTLTMAGPAFFFFATNPALNGLSSIFLKFKKKKVVASSLFSSSC